MSSYIGVRCPVCNKKFAEADDIVVCPVCGAPHHRDCYASTNQCAFAADHLSGKEWSDPAGQTAPGEGESATKACPRCGSANPPETIFCQVCGNPLAIQRPSDPPNAAGGQTFYGPGGVQIHMDAISMAYGGLPPDEEIDGETVRDLARYVGNGSAYYLPRFRLISENRRMLSPNFSAFIFNFLYYFYRKMYMVGAVMLLLYVLSIIPSYLYTWEILPQMLYNFGLGEAVEVNMAAAEHFYRLSGITRGINFAIGLLMSMCANRFYYNQTVAGVHAIRTSASQGQPPEGYSEMLARAGGSNKAAVIVVAATIIAVMLLLSIIMIHLRLNMQ